MVPLLQPDPLSDWVITHHAVDRYIQRHAPEMGRTDAYRAIRDAIPTAVPLTERTARGDEQWLMRELNVIAVVKREMHHGKPAIVTVNHRPVSDLIAEQRSSADRGGPKDRGTRRRRYA